MRLISQDGHIDVPYENVVLLASEYVYLPFESETYDPEPDGYEILVRHGNVRLKIAKVASEDSARRVLATIRRYYCSGEKVVYVSDILDEF